MNQIFSYEYAYAHKSKLNKSCVIYITSKTSLFTSAYV